MAVSTRNYSRGRFAAGMSALALGVAVMAVPGTAFAQQDDHHHDGGGNRGGGGGEQGGRPQAPPQARPAPTAPAPAARGENGRGQGQFGGQERQAPGNFNGSGNGGQGRAPQPNFAPGQARPAFQGQPGSPAPGRGDNAGRNDGGQWRNNGGPGRDDRGHDDRGRNDGGRNGGNPGYNGGPGRNDGGPGRNDGGRFDGGRDGGRFDGGPGRGGQPGYGRPGGGQWNHGWRQDNRYDWRGWRNQNRDTFHVGRYYPPYRDYSYNRLGIGFFLQPNFFGSDYWIADPYYYRLPPAYGPYHWVRYYNDVILVNTYNGEVADVIYDFFW